MPRCLDRRLNRKDYPQRSIRLRIDRPLNPVPETDAGRHLVSNVSYLASRHLRPSASWHFSQLCVRLSANKAVVKDEIPHQQTVFRRLA